MSAAPRPGKPGRGAGGKSMVAGAVESGRGQARGRRLGRLRLAVVPDVSASSLEGFLGRGRGQAGDDRDRRLVRLSRASRPRATPTSRSTSPPVLGRRGAPPARDPPGVRPGQALAARHPPRRGLAKHLPAYLDEFVFRFNRRTAKSISHRFARVIQQAVLTRPVTYHAIVAAAAT